MPHNHLTLTIQGYGKVAPQAEFKTMEIYFLTALEAGNLSQSIDRASLS